MGVTNQETHSSTIIAEIHHASRAGMDAEFMFERNAINVITPARPAVVIQQEFRHQEQ